MPLKSPSKPFSIPNKLDKPPRTLVVGGQYLVQRDGVATILDTRPAKKGLRREAYISFVGQDKRLDAWVGEDELGDQVLTSPKRKAEIANGHLPTTPTSNHAQAHARAQAPAANGPESFTSARRAQEPSPSVASTPEREHAAMTRVRNFEDVRFGEYLIKTWYYSPYPLPLDDPSHPGSSGTQHFTPARAASPAPVSGSASSKKRKLDEVREQHSHFTSHSHGRQEQHSHQGQQGQTQGQGLHRSVSTRTVNDMFASGVGKGGEGARGRLWVCDLCFKYMRNRAAWDRHTSSCTTLQPPGRKVYQRGSYTLWEVDGATAMLYCQNLSLFGKLFIDHKSVFFHVENFLFYVLCDAATSRRDQVMAFFSKEKVSYDDYNLACIVTFPPFQNRGFGKLLIEFSYYLTKHPSTRPLSLSPGTPERPLSDLGLKGYLAYWASVILRFLRSLLADAPPLRQGQGQGPLVLAESPKKVQSPVPLKGAATPAGGRTLRVRKSGSGVNGLVGAGADSASQQGSTIRVRLGDKEEAEFAKTPIPIPGYKGQYSLSLTLAEIAKACHLRVDDTAFTLSELGFLHHRRPALPRTSGSGSGSRPAQRRTRDIDECADGDDGLEMKGHGESGRERVDEEWKDVQVVITRQMVDGAFEKWRVKEKGVLDPDYVLL